MTATSQNSPPIDEQGVAAFLAGRGGGFEKTVRRMESVERWALDSTTVCPPPPNSVTPERAAGIRSKLERLSSLLERMAGASVTPDEEAMVSLLAFLHSGRAFALVAWVDEVWVGSGSRIVESAIEGMKNGEDAGFLLLDRLNHLERMFVLSQVLSPGSVRDVCEAITEMRGSEEVA